MFKQIFKPNAILVVPMLLGEMQILLIEIKIEYNNFPNNLTKLKLWVMGSVLEVVVQMLKILEDFGQAKHNKYK